MLSLAQKTDDLIEPLRKIANCIGAPLWDLAARLYLGWAFFRTGLSRFKDWKNGSFDSQTFLFEVEHPVPGLSPEIAAYTSMVSELFLPILVVLGLFGRVGAAGLLIMTAVIELTYIHSNDHILWAFLAAALFIKGPGRLSLDYVLLKKIRG